MAVGHINRSTQREYMVIHVDPSVLWTVCFASAARRPLHVGARTVSLGTPRGCGLANGGFGRRLGRAACRQAGDDTLGHLLTIAIRTSLALFEGRCSSECAAAMGDRGRMLALLALGTRKLLVAFGQHTCAQGACTHTGALCMRPGYTVVMATAVPALSEGVIELAQHLPQQLSTQWTSTAVRSAKCSAALQRHPRVTYAHHENSTRR